MATNLPLKAVGRHSKISVFSDEQIKAFEERGFWWENDLLVQCNRGWIRFGFPAELGFSIEKALKGKLDDFEDLLESGLIRVESDTIFSISAFKEEIEIILKSVFRKRQKKLSLVEDAPDADEIMSGSETFSNEDIKNLQRRGYKLKDDLYIKCDYGCVKIAFPRVRASELCEAFKAHPEFCKFLGNILKIETTYLAIHDHRHDHKVVSNVCEIVQNTLKSGPIQAQILGAQKVSTEQEVRLNLDLIEAEEMAGAMTDMRLENN